MGVGIGTGIVILAGDQRYPGLILMLEYRRVSWRNSRILAHLVNVTLSRKMDDDLVTPFEGM